MKIYEKLTRNVVPLLEQENLITAADKAQIARVADEIDRDIDERINAFTETLEKRISAFEERDFAAELSKSIEVEQAEALEKFKSMETQLSKLRELETALSTPVSGANTLEALEKLKTAREGLEKDVQDARDKVQKFSSAVGRTVGSAARKFFTGFLG